MLLIGLPPSFAEAISIEFDYSYDTSNFFGNQAAKDALERAAETFEPFYDTLSSIQSGGPNTWSARFTHPATGDELSVWSPVVGYNRLKVYVGARNLAGSSLGEGGPGGYYVQGTQAFLNTVVGRGEGNGTQWAVKGPAAYDFGPWGGSIAFDEPRNWHFNPDTPPSGNQSDFLSVAIHELGHIFGFGTADSFKNLISGQQFTGAKAVNLYGGNVPLENTLEPSHWADGTTSPNAGETVMDPIIYTGQRKLFTALDYAALDDLGWDVPAALLQPPADIPGDFNQDGAVDGLDVAVWQDGFGMTSGASRADGDADGDRDVDGADFLVWQNHFGEPNNLAGGALSSAAVPEPSALTITLLLLTLALARPVRLANS